MLLSPIWRGCRSEGKWQSAVLALFGPSVVRFVFLLAIQYILVVVMMMMKMMMMVMMMMMVVMMMASLSGTRIRPQQSWGRFSGLDIILQKNVPDLQLDLLILSWQYNDDNEEHFICNRRGKKKEFPNNPYSFLNFFPNFDKFSESLNIFYKFC